MAKEEKMLGVPSMSSSIDRNHWTRIEKKNWTVMLMCGTAMLYAARTIMPVCIVVVAKEMNWDKRESGTVLSAFFWGYTMTQFIGGYVSDHVGGEVVLFISASLWSVFTLFTPPVINISAVMYKSLSAVFAFRMMLGLSQGVHFPSITSLISRKVHDHEKSLTFSLIGTGAHCGTLLSGSLGSYLMENFGWETPFFLFGFGGLLWTFCLRYWSRKSEIYNGKTLELIATDGESGIQGTVHENVPWKTLFTKVPFWSLLVANYCQSNAFYILLSWLPTFFHENFPEARSWVFNVVPWLVIVPCNITAGWLADKLIKGGYQVTAVRKMLVSVLFCGCSLFLLLISFVSDYYSTLLCMTLAVASCGFYSSSLAINPVDIAPRHAGAVFGIMNMTSAIPGFVGVYMAGYILETSKSWSAVFNQTAAINITGWLVFLLLGTARPII
ncbi:hypothetical protein C0Q70_16434 [Pomacea canaliculata]|uniref:Major facilitator superfamily (MFS) profile domain-containing protein n=1 Tax=Pomacea canaliculata TaxID=400727 RepID=A0A2T7NPS4_POMCA|nr:solute carrier family 17 member 9-like [Pomacea canaliculata]PVD23171.1 hypothetical protein C0Q70_16434 [Pomacea canaliculata]